MQSADILRPQINRINDAINKEILSKIVGERKAFKDFNLGHLSFSVIADITRRVTADLFGNGG